MPDTRLNNIPERKATIALLALLCLAGLWLRLRNLGALGLVWCFLYVLYRHQWFLKV